MSDQQRIVARLHAALENSITSPRIASMDDQIAALVRDQLAHRGADLEDAQARRTLLAIVDLLAEYIAIHQQRAAEVLLGSLVCLAGAFPEASR